MPLKLVIPEQEGWDEVKEEFVNYNGATLQLEHSLISLSKWESIWHKPFISISNDGSMTNEELTSYVSCMVLTQNVDPHFVDFLTEQNYKEIREYIENPMTATWFRQDPKKHGRSGMGGPALTSEYIYYLMFDYGIPKECEKWHLNRLMTLIRVIEEKNSQGNKKMSAKDRMSQYAAMKAARRKPKV